MRRVCLLDSRCVFLSLYSWSSTRAACYPPLLNIADVLIDRLQMGTHPLHLEFYPCIP